MKRVISKRGAIALSLFLTIAFLVRPGAESLRGRISQSMAQALGHNVEIGSVHLRFLPRLGFELGSVLIHDDPAFGTEALLRAPEVTAWLSISALLHGRFAIASLTLSDASVNLTRSADGRWNIEDLLVRTSRSSLAPTGSSRSGKRPAFPYIEASQARVNFKSGFEKTHFAFANAEFALWQDSDNTWGARLQANPIRTDANLTDTGVIKLEGLWQRAPQAQQTPLQFSFEWKRAQVGQLSSLISGEDKGWRGAFALSGTVMGRPEDLRVTADASIDGFRRQEVFGERDLRLAVHCAAEFDRATRSVTNLDCGAPSGSGLIQVKGSGTIGNSLSSMLSSYDLWLVADKVPADSVLTTIRDSYPNFANDLSAAGELSAALETHNNGTEPPIFDGRGSLEHLQLSSATIGNVAFATVPFTLVSGATTASNPSVESGKLKHSAVSENTFVGQPRIEVGPMNLATGKASLQSRAMLSTAGYEASVQGEAPLRRVLQLAHIAGIPSPTVSADGSALLDLGISGTWRGQLPLVRGKARLRSIRAQVRGLNSPLEITTAELSIDPELVKVQNLIASTGDVVWRGSLQIPRPCHAPDACPFDFSLHTTGLSAMQVNALLNPAVAQKPWYSFLSLNSRQQSFFLQAHAAGNISVDQLHLGTASCSHFAAALRLDSGRLTLSNIRGDIFDGRATGRWVADFSRKPPQYSAKGILKGISLSEVADLMHNSWIDGTGSVDYDLAASGWKLQDVLSSASADANFSMVQGSFSHVVLPGSAAPLRAELFSGNLQLEDGQFTFRDAKLKSDTSVYKVSGTASLNGSLGMKIIGGTAYSLSGTLFKTRVTTTPVAQAALKP